MSANFGNLIRDVLGDAFNAASEIVHGCYVNKRRKTPDPFYVSSQGRRFHPTAKERIRVAIAC